MRLATVAQANALTLGTGLKATAKFDGEDEATLEISVPPILQWYREDSEPPDKIYARAPDRGESERKSESRTTRDNHLACTCIIPKGCRW
jgi:hypothetical protein